MRLIQLIIILFIFYSYTIAGNKNNNFINIQKQFILDLYKNKRYFDCVAETQRLLSYKDDSLKKDDLYYFVNACYYSARQYKTVITKLESNDNGKSSNKKKPMDIFLLSQSYHKLGYHDMSINILNRIDYTQLDERIQKELFINRAEIMINNHKYDNLFHEIEKAEKHIKKFNNSFTLYDFKKDLQNYYEIGLKSRWLSASLSAILPGAGQIYSGKLMDGLISFTAVAGSAFGSYYFYNKKEKTLAFTFAFFSCLFYGGNVYGAWNSALHTNNKLNNQFMNQITKKYDLIYNPGDYINSEIFK